MNKWLIRIFGVMILVIVGLFFFENWFAPEVPPQLRQGLVVDHRPDDGIALRQEQSPISPQEAQGRMAEAAAGADVSGIHLTSLENSPNDADGPLPQSQQAESNEPNPAGQAQGTKEAISPSAAPAAVDVWVQAGSFGNRENAERRAQELKQKGMPVAIESVTVNGESYNRLYVGPLRQDQVKGALRDLSAMGVDARQISR